MGESLVDLVIVGGGINGVGVARDAAGRGLSVVLCEMGDLAQATSSASTKLIHGGLRYLEYFEFRLVHEALVEREVLWRMAPHIIWPLRFVLPHNPNLRPAWFVRAGLFLYDHIGGRRRLAPTRVLDLRRDTVGGPLKPAFHKAFEYSDCWVDDARLVVLNAVDAARRGAEVRTRSRCVGARADGDLWQVEIEDVRSGRRDTVSARVLINAAGPWVNSFLEDSVALATDHRVRAVKGSHIVVPRLFDHDRAYIFQNDDKRVAFAIPYERDFTLIGTTDEDFDGDPGSVAITDDEVAYLCRLMSMYFAKPIEPGDVVYSYSGVRPLYDDGTTEAQEATRDYVLKVDGGGGSPPILNIFGGKITTYRKLAEQTLAKLGDHLPRASGPWTKGAPLPGGDFDANAVTALADDLRHQHAFLSEHQALRMVRAYGTLTRRVFDGVRSEADMGIEFGGGLTEREVTYLMDEEWAETADDVLWRRTKLGLRLSAEQAAELDAWMVGHNSRRSAVERRSDRT